MPKWEYCLVERILGNYSPSAYSYDIEGHAKTIGQSIEEIIQELNKLGDDGWEVVGYGPSKTPGSDAVIWTLKRLKE